MGTDLEKCFPKEKAWTGRSSGERGSSGWQTSSAKPSATSTCNVTQEDLACNSGVKQCRSSYSTMDESSSEMRASRSEFVTSAAAREEIPLAQKRLSSERCGEWRGHCSSGCSIGLRASIATVFAISTGEVGNRAVVRRQIRSCSRSSRSRCEKRTATSVNTRMSWYQEIKPQVDRS